MAVIIYSSSKLLGLGKSGKIRPDKDGYYDLVLGALSVFNSAGEFYQLKESDKLFKQNSRFMNAVRERYIYSENGHPERKGRSDEAYLDRCLSINQDKMTNHIGDVWLDDTLWKSHPELMPKHAVATMGKIKPYGPLKDMCSDALANPNQNLCYSIRSFTKTGMVGGKVIKIITHIVTYDLVYAPGISVASKFNSPTMESLTSIGGDSSDIVGMLKNIKNKSTDELVTLEADRAIEDLIESTENNIIVPGPIWTGM